MTVGAHCGAHEIHLHEIDDIQVNKQVPSKLKVGFQISPFHC
jgi:hypothetical protein